MRTNNRQQQYTILLAGELWLLGHYGTRIGAFKSRISLALFILRNGCGHMVENPEILPPEIWKIAANEVERERQKAKKSK